jgi:hypothetical protein
MLQRTVTFTYATVLRILGMCFLVYGLYLILGALTANNWDSGLALGWPNFEPQFLVTFALSLVLLALYKPVTQALAWLIVSRDERPNRPLGRASGHLAPS